MNRKIVIVEDDPLVAEHLKTHLLNCNYQVVGIFASGEETIAQLPGLAPDLVLMDIILEGAMDGIETANLIRQSHNIPVIFLTAYSNEEFVERARITEPFAYILKPFNERELRLTIEIALYKYGVEQNLRESETHLEAAQRIGKMGSWDWHIRNNTLKWSKEIYHLFGLSEQAFAATYDAFLLSVHPEDRAIVTQAVDAALHRQQPYDIDHRIVLPDGSEKIVHEHGEVQFDQRGVPERMLGTVQDVTEQRHAENKLKLFSTIFESAAEGIVITDTDHRIVMINNAYCDITGFGREELLGAKPSKIQSGLHEADFYQNMQDSLAKTGKWQGEILDKRKNGEIFPKWLSITALHDDRGRVANYVGVFTDITELKINEKRLHQLAYYDALTGLSNRTHFLSRLKQEIVAAQRKSLRFCVLFIDLDRFKDVNDSHGHHVGDLLLQEVARRLQSMIRETDMACRQGGDEFLIFMQDINSPQQAAAIGTKIVQSLSEPYFLQGNELSLTPSIGIALYPQDGDDEEVIIRHADAAMYHAKKLGRSQFQFFTENLTAEVMERLQIEADLRKALHKNEFELHYQPQLDLRTGRLVGVEALVRWQHPIHGTIPPSEFIPIAEEIGLIIPLGSWILKEACSQMKQWQEEGVSDIRMSVNLSAIQFLDKDLAGHIQRILAETGLDADSLDLEVTESVSMASPENTISLMKTLTRAGMSLSIDDFGTGYSSLAYLKLFPIRTLKIDRTFVKDIETDANDAGICDVAVLLAHKLGLDVVAEGVETEAQLKFLISIGCDKIQGFWLSKPLDSEMAKRFIKNHTPLTGMSHVDFFQGSDIPQSVSATNA